MIDKELIRQAAEDVDIFEDDLTAEYDRLCTPRHRLVRLWPLAAAACVAGIVAVLLTPPKEEALQQPPSPLAQVESVSDTIVHEESVLPEPTQPSPQLAQSTPKPVHKVQQQTLPAIEEVVDTASQTLDEEQLIREIIARQEQILRDMEQEMSQMDIRSEILLRGKRMRHTYATLEDEF